MRAFVEQGGGCRATYFNRAKRLRPPADPPRIVLANSPPSLDGPLDLLSLLPQRHRGLGHG